MSEQGKQSVEKTSASRDTGGAGGGGFEDQSILQGSHIASYLSSGQNTPPDPKTVLNMQSTFGNHSTIQLLRKNHSQLTLQRKEQAKVYPFANLRMAIQRDKHAIEEIASTDPEASKPSQDVDSGGKLTPIYAQAWEVAWTVFKPTVEDITKQLAGAESSVAPLKGRERAAEKAKDDYGGDTAGLVDIARGSIVCKDADQVLECYELVKGAFKIVRVKNRFANPSDGYRDLMLNVALPKDGKEHIAELQIHLKAIIEAKKEGHSFYETARTIEAIPEEQRTEEQKKELAEAKSQMQSLYDEAWKKAKAIPDEG